MKKILKSECGLYATQSAIVIRNACDVMVAAAGENLGHVVRLVVADLKENGAGAAEGFFPLFRTLVRGPPGFCI